MSNVFDTDYYKDENLYRNTLLNNHENFVNVYCSMNYLTFFNAACQNVTDINLFIEIINAVNKYLNDMQQFQYFHDEHNFRFCCHNENSEIAKYYFNYLVTNHKHIFDQNPMNSEILYFIYLIDDESIMLECLSFIINNYPNFILCWTFIPINDDDEGLNLFIEMLNESLDNRFHNIIITMLNSEHKIEYIEYLQKILYSIRNNDRKKYIEEILKNPHKTKAAEV